VVAGRVRPGLHRLEHAAVEVLRGTHVVGQDPHDEERGGGGDHGEQGDARAALHQSKVPTDPQRQLNVLGTLNDVDLANLEDSQSFTTLDGSTIREVAGRKTLPSQHQSLAEATVPPGHSTIPHHHVQSEELYFFTGGE